MRRSALTGASSDNNPLLCAKPHGGAHSARLDKAVKIDYNWFCDGIEYIAYSIGKRKKLRQCRSLVCGRTLARAGQSSYFSSVSSLISDR